MGRRRLGLLTAALAGAIALASGAAAHAAEHWVGAWSAAQQVPEPRNALAPEDLRDATLRQVVHLSLGGGRIRVRVSNAFGTEPLTLTSVHVARPLSPASPAIDPKSDRAVTFDGRSEVTIPAGAEYLSDPIDFAAPALSSLAVSMHFEAPPAVQTSHPGSRATSYLVHGDAVSAPDLPEAKRIEHWWQLSGVEVDAPEAAAALVAFGDSITDGHAATPNGDDRWPDDLARRLQASGRSVAVLNKGIGGNRILADGLGPNGLARFDRDVLAQPGVRWAIVLEGVNDLGTLTVAAPVPQAEHDRLVARLIGAYRQMIERAHERGIRVIGGTITPFVGNGYYHADSVNEADRQAINRWIRTSGAFDAVVDFDATVRDPSHPDRLAPAYDCGDHLHPSPAGYRAMAEAVPLSLFDR
jgi:lysophospholipase L1-like esterase